MLIYHKVYKNHQKAYNELLVLPFFTNVCVRVNNGYFLKVR